MKIKYIIDNKEIENLKNTVTQKIQKEYEKKYIKFLGKILAKILKSEKKYIELIDEILEMNKKEFHFNYLYIKKYNVISKNNDTISVINLAITLIFFIIDKIANFETKVIIIFFIIILSIEIVAVLYSDYLANKSEKKLI